jgi:glycosyltransferase involved in cell wall biosynthesis
VRALLRPCRRSRTPARATPKVTILLSHAWGMGGTIRTMLNVAGGLAERHEVEVLSLWRTCDEPFFAFPPRVTVTAADDRRAAGPMARLLGRVPGVLVFPGERTSRRTTVWSDLQLVRRLRASRADVVIGTRPAHNLLVAQLRPAPALVAAEHADFAAYTPLLRREIRGRYGALDVLVVLHEGARRPFEHFLGDAVRVRAIPNAVPPQRGGRARLDRPVVVAVGRLVRAKDFGRLVQAFALVAEAHPEWRLRICGDGPRRRMLAALIAELGLERQVELVGSVRDVEAELEAASIFALSSRSEGQSLALLEAMAKGLAVVSLDSAQGPCAVIEHGVDGLLVPADCNEAAFARSICALIESAPLRRRLGEAAVRKAAEFDPRAVGARWQALIEEVTA